MEPFCAPHHALGSGRRRPWSKCPCAPRLALLGRSPDPCPLGYRATPAERHPCHQKLGLHGWRPPRAVRPDPPFGRLGPAPTPSTRKCRAIRQVRAPMGAVRPSRTSGLCRSQGPISHAARSTREQAAAPSVAEVLCSCVRGRTAPRSPVTSLGSAEFGHAGSLSAEAAAARQGSSPMPRACRAFAKLARAGGSRRQPPGQRCRA